MRETNSSYAHSSRGTVTILFCALILAFTTLSCDSQADRSSANIGKVRLSLYADTASVKKGINSNQTKALPDELEKFKTVDDYKIDIVQDDKSVKAFDRYDQMPTEIELPEGTYTLVASKGDDKPAAFENPFFEGSTSFTVKEGMSTPLDVTCTLANARITVDYTEEFKNTYSTYTVLLKTPFTVEDKLEITQKESRPAYLQVAPDGTDLAIAIRLKKNGEETEKTYPVPNSLKMERRQNIHLLFKPGEGTDGLGLDIWLDNELTEQTLNTDIPDYMWKPFNQPKLNPESFPENGLFEVAAGDVEGINPTVGFVVPAGIGAFHVLRWTENVVGDTISYDLATPEGAKEAKEAGFEWNLKDMDCLKDVRKSGQLYIKNAIANLQGSEEGETYGFAFYANDALPKANYTERLSFKVRVKPAGAPLLTFPTFPISIVEGDNMPTNYITLIKAATGIDPDNTFLTITGKDNNPQKYKIKESVNELKALGIETEITNIQYKLTFLKTFSNKLDVPDGKSEQTYIYKIEMKELGTLERALSVERSFTVKAPVFAFTTTEGDAFAKRVVLRTDMPIGNIEKLKFRYKTTSGDWNEVVTSGMEKEGVNYVDTLKGLTPNTEYQIQAVYNDKRYSIETATVHTESIGVLPNSGFEQWSIAADQNGKSDKGSDVTIDTAGEMPEPGRCWEVWQPWGEKVVSGWNTINKTTTKDGGTKTGTVTALSGGGLNWTRYVANSGTIQTTGQNGLAALIRTVGWGSGNTAAATDKMGTVNNITPGELYLGTYNASNHTPQYGIEFTSRPSGFLFDCKYLRKNTDTFVAEIVILSDDNKEIAKAQLPSTLSNATEWITRRVMLEYNSIYRDEKAHKIYIRFKSGISESTNDIITYPPARNLSNGEYVGSQLYIDNVELIYE